MNYMQQTFSKLPKPVKAGLAVLGGFVLTQLGGCAPHRVNPVGAFSGSVPVANSLPSGPVHFESRAPNDGYVYGPDGRIVEQGRSSQSYYDGQIITNVEPDMQAAFQRGYRVAERGLWEGYGTAVVYGSGGMELCYAGKRHTRHGWEDIYRPCRDYNYSSGVVVGIPVYFGGVGISTHTGSRAVRGEFHYPRGTHGNFLRGGNIRHSGRVNDMGIPKSSGRSGFKTFRYRVP